MNRLITLLLAGLTITSQGQVVDDYQPDSDGDGCIGMSDLLSLLSVFGSCEAQSFACGDPINYQGYDYATVLIGDQCWFAENLRSESYSNGDLIPSNLSNEEWAATASGASSVMGEGNAECLESSIPEACDEEWSLIEYGRLYNWHAVNDERDLCPTGWHVPTDWEWSNLLNHLGDPVSAGEKLKTDYGWNGGNGTNSSGFSGLPSGTRGWSSAVFGYAGNRAYWWSSSTDGQKAWARWLSNSTQSVGNVNTFLTSGFSVRCIQD